MSLAQVLAPAIRVANDGFVVDQTFFDQTQANVDFFDDLPASARLFLDPDGTPRDVGTVFRNPDLAGTYQRIAQQGPDGFYRGAVARAIVETVQHPPVGPGANHTWRPGRHDHTRPADVRGAAASAHPRAATGDSTCSGWVHPRAAARPSARRSTSSPDTTSRR